MLSLPGENKVIPHPFLIMFRSFLIHTLQGGLLILLYIYKIFLNLPGFSELSQKALFVTS